MESKTVKFIDGSFEAGEAKELLNELIKSKINFHNIKIFSNKIKDWNSPVKAMEDRVNELMEAKKRITEILSLAEEKEATVEISSSISIKVVGKVETKQLESVEIGIA